MRERINQYDRALKGLLKIALIIFAMLMVCAIFTKCSAQDKPTTNDSTIFKSRTELLNKFNADINKGIAEIGLLYKTLGYIEILTWEINEEQKKFILNKGK